MSRSKIIIAVNSMISNEQNISRVERSGKLAANGYAFSYNEYVWLIFRYEDAHGIQEHILHYFPEMDSDDIQSIVDMDEDDWDSTKRVTYRTSEIDTTEARATFSELFVMLSEKAYGIDDVLNDIISDDEPFWKLIMHK